MRMTCRLFAVGFLILFFAACSTGTRANIEKNKLSAQERKEGKYYVFFQYSSLIPYDIQDQLYLNMMELMHKADALADDDLTVDYVVVLRLDEYKNISAYERALYGIYAGKDIMQSEVAVVAFDSLKTAKFRNLSKQSTSFAEMRPNSSKETISLGAETIFKMHDDHLVKANLLTKNRKPGALMPIELIRMHSEKIADFILGKR